MAGRIRQLMWESNRRQPGEGNLGSLFFLVIIILPLMIVTQGKILAALIPLFLGLSLFKLFTL